MGNVTQTAIDGEAGAEWDAPGAEEASRDRLTKWELRKIKTRRLILHAGRELFADRGFITPRVEDVARAAGVSRAAFYLHFRSLEDLIQAVFSREVRWQLRRYRSLTNETLGSTRKIRGWLERFFASFRQERQYILIVYRALSSNPETMRVIFDEHRRVVGSLARRVPSLRLVGEDGKPDRVRVTELHTLLRRIDELSLYSAFNAWSEDTDLAVDLLARDIIRFAEGPAAA
ncbi:TetR/AcrR family transcriptional regulator [Sphingomonas immobilis]|uniref:Helix-turn-helix domain-containing protein n=1 Tax=Sphingomonas immobilis TaxID=3063997 RepID=A0ABT9A0G3_9SPHN|nr:TetR/AcrR family transcriptional regulator [Sphingomonas sp. CA1-15]MDO7842182.1 helix-turn-helix domain-containing protein [Sphingomonas sp. CA1-15]